MKKKIVMKQEDDLTLEEGFEKFIRDKIVMNKAPKTIDYYRVTGGFFLTFLQGKGVQYISEITEDYVSNYIIYLREKNPSLRDTSINNYLRSVRALCNYYIKRKMLDSMTVTLIRASKLPKEPYTEEEQNILTEKPNLKKCSFPEYRNWVITCHFLSTGNRSRTVRCIKIGDVNLKEKLIILGEVKNNIPYTIPISKEYYPILKEYMSIRNGKEDECLFCNQYGKQLTENGFKTIMKRYNQKRGIEKTSPHLFRHTFAKNWIVEGGSSKKLQKALGISSSVVIDEYLRIYGSDLKQDFDTYTPFGKLDVNRKRISMDR